MSNSRKTPKTAAPKPEDTDLPAAPLASELIAVDVVEVIVPEVVGEPPLVAAAEKKAHKDKKKKNKKDKKSKEAVIIRFDDGQLAEIDGRADGLGLSRAAFVRMAVAQALGKA